jgi:hypothetical protein
MRSCVVYLYRITWVGVGLDAMNYWGQIIDGEIKKWGMRLLRPAAAPSLRSGVTTSVAGIVLDEKPEAVPPTAAPAPPSVAATQSLARAARKRAHDDEESRVPAKQHEVIVVHAPPVVDGLIRHFTVSMTDVKIEGRLGAGAFGEVCLGTWRGSRGTWC